MPSTVQESREKVERGAQIKGRRVKFTSTAKVLEASEMVIVELDICI